VKTRRRRRGLGLRRNTARVGHDVPGSVCLERESRCLQKKKQLQSPPASRKVVCVCHFQIIQVPCTQRTWRGREDPRPLVGSRRARFAAQAGFGAVILQTRGVHANPWAQNADSCQVANRDEPKSIFCRATKHLRALTCRLWPAFFPFRRARQKITKLLWARTEPGNMEARN
jgi:hypothetical protein